MKEVLAHHKDDTSMIPDLNLVCKNGLPYENETTTNIRSPTKIEGFNDLLPNHDFCQLSLAIVRSTQNEWTQEAGDLCWGKPVKRRCTRERQKIPPPRSSTNQILIAVHRLLLPGGSFKPSFEATCWASCLTTDKDQWQLYLGSLCAIKNFSTNGKYSKIHHYKRLHKISHLGRSGSTPINSL